MRYARVHEILRSDNALSKKLSKNTAAVCRPDQTSKDFPVEVIYVTDEIHKAGMDAYTVSKLEVIRFAHRLLVANSVPIKLPEAPPPEPPKVKKEKLPKPPKVKKEKPPKVPRAKRRAVPPKTSAAPVPSPAGVEPKTSGEVEACPHHSEAESVKAQVVAVKPPPEFVRPSIPFVVGVAILSLLQSILTLLESCASSGDNEAKELAQKINELIDEVHRRTILPSAEKETSSTS